MRNPPNWLVYSVLFLGSLGVGFGAIIGAGFLIWCVIRIARVAFGFE